MNKRKKVEKRERERKREPGEVELWKNGMVFERDGGV